MPNSVGNTPNFNLWTEPWIALEQKDAVTQHSIRDALINAHEYYAVYDPSPLVVVGVFRLLTAILQDALDLQENGDLEELWKAGKFPADRIQQFGIQYAARFDLFSEDEPFLQSADLPLRPQTPDEQKDRTTVARLFPEIPSGTFVTHYRHSLEHEQIFSPSTVALGLAAIPPFVSSGGPGLMPSINGVPPIYVLPGGKNLFESLTSSLISHSFLEDSYLDERADMVWWKRPAPVIVKESKKGGTGDSQQLSKVGYLHGLTFPARKIRVHPEILNLECSRSGQFSQWNIRTMTYRMGESISEDLFWRDPFVAYRLPEKEQGVVTSGKLKKGKKKEKPTPIRPQQNRGKEAWREFTGLFLQKKDSQTYRPLFLDQLANLSINKTREVFPFQCVAMQTDGKMKFFEWFNFGFDVPPSLLQDPDGAMWTDEALLFAGECAKAIAAIFSRVFGQKTKNRERFKRLRERLESDYWSVLGSEFREFIMALGKSSQHQQTLDRWFDMAIKEAQRAFDNAADSTGDDGNTMCHIVQGKAMCWRQLNVIRNQSYKGE